MNIALAGYGLEGRASAAYWRARGDLVTILDEKAVTDAPVGVTVITGERALEHLGAYDMVVRTASLRPDKLQGVKNVWSATNEFFDRCPAPIIGVTGTKGKGTTSSLITSILRAAGRTVHLVGNIGVPALEVLPVVKQSDVVVFELSSFQLWDLQKSPQVAVVLMIEPDHMDVHMDMDEYVGAKANIARFQTASNVVVFHPNNLFSAQIAAAGMGRKIRYNDAEDKGCYTKENTFFIQEEQICHTGSLRLPGQHNVENACAAITAVWCFDETILADHIQTGLETFEGLPHRLKFIRNVDGVRYFDDNYSSAPGAAIAAIRSFTEPEVLILGGYDKKVDFHELAEVVAKQANIKHIILMGQTRHRLAAAFDAAGVSAPYDVTDASTLEPVIADARNAATFGDVVIMSPGCASFGMFRNFSDRGNQFVALVEAM